MLPSSSFEKSPQGRRLGEKGVKRGLDWPGPQHGSAVVSKRTVLLDLDGTLTDPAPGFIASIRYAMESLELETPDDETIATAIGPPLHDTLSSFLGPAHQGLLNKAVELYRERYFETGLYENSVYAGVVDALETLRDAQAPLFVATSKPRIIAKRILEHFDLSQFFSGVYGSELEGPQEKGPIIAGLLDNERVDPRTAVMVGDRSHDVIGALANEITPIGVLWGYGSEAELRDAGAKGLLRAPADLLDLDSILGRN